LASGFNRRAGNIAIQKAKELCVNQYGIQMGVNSQTLNPEMNLL
jgi:hypothetical protein